MHHAVMTSIEPGAGAGGRHERRKARTRAMLLAAARRLFAAKGAEATTIAEIAEEADIGVGSFYNHFRTKDEVLAALLSEALSEQLRLLQLRQQQVEDPAERVAIAHRHLVGAAREDPDWGRLLVRLELSHRVTASVLREAALRDLQEGRAAGRFVVNDTDVALQASGGALIGVIQAVLHGDVGPGAEVAHAEGILRSFGVPIDEAAKIASRPLPALP
jgi:AcrR family transcriptional regulator